MPLITSEHRFACCIHCPDEGCPRVQGHAVACTVRGCQSYEPPFGETPIFLADSAPGVVGDISGWYGAQRLEEIREQLIHGLSSVVGYEPLGARALLRALSHPTLVTAARQYFEALDSSLRCTKYEPPWNCAREAEALYENLNEGLLGANQRGIGFNETWCESCRKKVVET